MEIDEKRIEVIARIIDPAAWSMSAEAWAREGSSMLAAVRAPSLEKARAAILAYESSRSQSSDAFNEGAEAMRAATIKVVQPPEDRPCDCRYCECGNKEQEGEVLAWDLCARRAEAIAHIPLSDLKRPADRKGGQ